MSTFSKDFLRKYKTGENAIVNMDNKTIVSPENDIDEQYHSCTPSETTNIGKVLRDSYNLIWHRQLFSSRGIWGKFKIFVKKVIRRLIIKTTGWFWLPVINQQTEFNNNVSNTLTEILSVMQDAKFLSFTPSQEKLDYLMGKANITCDLSLVTGRGIDYFDFEDNFRGSREYVHKCIAPYLEYYIGKQNVLDIGCGRGEFLELMQKNEISATGVDCYTPFVLYCNKNGYSAVEADALTYLNSLPDDSLGGIFMSHVVEHLAYDYLLALLECAYKKLKKGCCFVVITPNSEAIKTYAYFYADFGHIKPVHYLALAYLFRHCGFENVERYDNPVTKFDDVVTPISGKQIENIEKFNLGINRLNQLLTANNDFTLIAKKE
jgi:O-antigen chain-terminating methyltransferase